MIAEYSADYRTAQLWPLVACVDGNTDTLFRLRKSDEKHHYWPSLARKFATWCDVKSFAV